jgi:hypothetical protein
MIETWFDRVIHVEDVCSDCERPFAGDVMGWVSYEHSGAHWRCVECGCDNDFIQSVGAEDFGGDY